MPTVDPTRFQTANINHMLEAGLQLVRNRIDLPTLVRDAFFEEARSWMDIAPRGRSAATISKAWLSINDAVLDFLDVLVGADTQEWESWVQRTGKALSSPANSIRVAEAPSDAKSVETRRYLDVISVAATYDLDIPETPAAWRSISILQQSAPDRLAELQRLITEFQERLARQFVLDIDSRIDASLQRSSPRPFERDQYRRPTSNAGKRVQSQSTGNNSSAAPVARRQTTRTPDKLVEAVQQFTLIELSDFVKKFEEVFEVTAAAPVAVAAASRSAAAPEDSEEPNSFDVVLEAVGEKKLQVIRSVRDLTSLGLGEAKALVDGAPKAVVTAVTKETAEKVKGQLEAAGATVTVR